MKTVREVKEMDTNSYKGKCQLHTGAVNREEVCFFFVTCMISKSYGGNMLSELYNLPLKKFRQNLGIAPLRQGVR